MRSPEAILVLWCALDYVATLVGISWALWFF